MLKIDHNYSCVGRSLSISARKYPAKRMIVDANGRSMTYGQSNFRANQLAQLLLSKGLNKGDHVALLLPSSIEHVLSLYAIAKIGGVVVALEPRWTPEEIARALTLFDCKMLIVSDDWQSKVTSSARGTLQLGILPILATTDGTSSLGELVATQPDDEPAVDVHDDDIFTLLLTSGTTGLPKGCVRSHRSVEMGCIMDRLGRRQDDRSQELVVAPMHYGSGRQSVLGQVYIGGTIHLMHGFDAQQMAAYIQREKITDIAMAPTMCMRLLSLPDLDRYDFSSLNTLKKVGSPFHATMLKQLIELVTPNIYQSFASTETAGVTILRPDEQLAKIGSAGRPRWGVEVEIVDPENGSKLGSGEEGEIRIRSNCLCQGYYKNDEEQQKAFKDGWYCTGDIGLLDEDGYLFVKGRLKEMIKTGSINVAPREVENTILMIEGVRDVAVVGVPDPEWGEAIKALVVRDGRSKVSAEDIVTNCRKMLAGFKVPKYVTFIEAIDRNATGKVTPQFKAAVIAGDIKSVA
jgi:fatty-acyl-CoA synthase